MRFETKPIPLQANIIRDLRLGNATYCHVLSARGDVFIRWGASGIWEGPYHQGQDLRFPAPTPAPGSSGDHGDLDIYSTQTETITLVISKSSKIGGLSNRVEGLFRHGELMNVIWRPVMAGMRIADSNANWAVPGHTDGNNLAAAPMSVPLFSENIPAGGMINTNRNSQNANFFMVEIAGLAPLTDTVLFQGAMLPAGGRINLEVFDRLGTQVFVVLDLIDTDGIYRIPLANMLYVDMTVVSVGAVRVDAVAHYGEQQNQVD